MTSKLALGREALVTDTSIYNPFDKDTTLVDEPAFITKMGIDFRSKAKVSLSYRLAGMSTRGIAPVFYVAPNKSVKGAGPPYTITCDMATTLNTFTPASTRPDHMFFDCLEYNVSSGSPTADASYTTSSCSCSAYKVMAHRTDSRTHTNDIARNSGELEVTSVSVDSGGVYTSEVVLTDTSAGHTHYTAWDVTKGYVVMWDFYDQCEDCQKDYWLFFADTANTLGAASDPGHRWV